MGMQKYDSYITDHTVPTSAANKSFREKPYMLEKVSSGSKKYAHSPAASV